MDKLASILMTLLTAILSVVSPTLRGLLSDLIKTLYKKAKETDNQFDDLAVKLLAALIGVDLE